MRQVVRESLKSTLAVAVNLKFGYLCQRGITLCRAKHSGLELEIR